VGLRSESEGREIIFRFWCRAVDRGRKQNIWAERGVVKKKQRVRRQFTLADRERSRGRLTTGRSSDQTKK